MSDHDDELIGRVLTRREVVTLLGLAGATALLGRGTAALRAQGGSATRYLPLVSNGESSATPTATIAPTATATATQVPVPTCIVRPEQTEGPYFVDDQLNRSDIRSEPSTGLLRPGERLDLAFRVSQIASNGCFALQGAIVDVWHCDALGIYSGVGPTSGLEFLRGYQVTDANGLAQFITIYPGWYPGRTVHIHFKIRVQTGPGQTFDFTAQLYFDDALTDMVFTLPPYNKRGPRDTRNDDDFIYQNGGPQLTLDVTETPEGYAATFEIGLVL